MQVGESYKPLIHSLFTSVLGYHCPLISIAIRGPDSGRHPSHEKFAQHYNFGCIPINSKTFLAEN